MIERCPKTSSTLAHGGRLECSRPRGHGGPHRWREHEEAVRLFNRHHRPSSLPRGRGR